ncbi:MAG TPA: 4'-phosphopantetheinyl transferase superfamily protein [Longimicrobiales bacterium]
MSAHEAGDGARPPADVIAALGRIFPAGIATAALAADATPAELSEIESQAGAHYSGSRLHHYALGRACARLALRELTGGESCIGMLPGGAPAWPDGIIGSISHSRLWVAAAAAHAGAIQDIGIDVEDATRHSVRLERWACTAAERTRLRDLPVPDGSSGWSTVVFSAKEAVYKAVNPSTGIPLRFHDVELDFDTAARTYVVRVVRAIDGPSEWVTRLKGRYEVVHGAVLSSAILHAERA